jgi:hypothetical protein
MNEIKDKLMKEIELKMDRLSLMNEEISNKKSIN